MGLFYAIRSFNHQLLLDMLILHAAQSEVGLLLWGEMPPGELLRSRPRKKKGFPVPAPCALGAKDLQSLLEKHFPTVGAQAHQIEAAAWLPSTKAGPLPSSTLLESNGKHDDKAALAPWLIPAFLVEYGSLLVSRPQN